MKNLIKIFVSLICIVSLVSFAKADDSTEAGSWSDWVHDEHVLPELYIRSRCVQNPTDAKKAQWEIEFSDIGSALVVVKGKDWKFDIASNQQGGPAHVEAKSCSKPLELKMDGGVPVKNYNYKLTLKDHMLTVKPNDHQKIDWAGWLTAGMMGAAAMTQTMAQNDAQMAEMRAQQQAEQQAAAEARAQQMAEFEEQRAAQQQAEAAALAERAAAQRAAQEAQQQAQLAAQQAASRASINRPGSNSGSAYSGPTSSSPQPQPSDLSISQNYVDPVCNNGVTTAHYQLSNGSYSNAQMTVEFDYQTGGVTSSFTETHNIGPRSSNDYSHQIPCGGQALLSDYGNSSILQWQFY